MTFDEFKAKANAALDSVAKHLVIHDSCIQADGRYDEGAGAGKLEMWKAGQI